MSTKQFPIHKWYVFTGYGSPWNNTCPPLKGRVWVGVKSIEHGMLVDEEAVEMMAKNDVVFLIQALVAKQLLSVYKEPDPRLAKAQAAWNNVGKVYKNTL